MIHDVLESKVQVKSNITSTKGSSVVHEGHTQTEPKNSPHTCGLCVTPDSAIFGRLEDRQLSFSQVGRVVTCSSEKLEMKILSYFA